jgi:hypothetical protein
MGKKPRIMENTKRIEGDVIHTLVYQQKVKKKSMGKKYKIRP